LCPFFHFFLLFCLSLPLFLHLSFCVPFFPSFLSCFLTFFLHLSFLISSFLSHFLSFFLSIFVFFLPAFLSYSNIYLFLYFFPFSVLLFPSPLFIFSLSVHLGVTRRSRGLEKLRVAQLVRKISLQFNGTQSFITVFITVRQWFLIVSRMWDPHPFTLFHKYIRFTIFPYSFLPFFLFVYYLFPFSVPLFPSPLS
jgi:hypothetical protein